MTAIDLTRLSGRARALAARVSARPLPMMAVVTLGLGLVLFGLGVVKATIARPATTVTHTVRVPAHTYLVVSDDSILPSDTRLAEATAVRISLSAEPANARIFVGIARSRDVEALVLDTGRSTLALAGDLDGELTLQPQGKDFLPIGPTSSDIFVAKLDAPGPLNLTWPRTAGVWRLVAQSSEDAILSVVLTYSVTPRAGAAPFLLGSGLVLAALGAALVAALRRRPADRLLGLSFEPADPPASGPAPAPEPEPEREQHLEPESGPRS